MARDLNTASIDVAIASRDTRLAASALQEIDTLLAEPIDENTKISLLLKKAFCFEIVDRLADCKQLLSLVRQQTPQTDLDTRLQCDFIEGCIYDSQKQSMEALHVFSCMLSTYSEKLSQSDLYFLYEEIQRRRAFDLVDTSSFAAAIPVLQETLSFELTGTQRGEILANLGRCFLELNDDSSAKDAFTSAMSDELPEAWKESIHFYLGISCARLKLFGAAKEEFLRAEAQAVSSKLPILDIYSWLAYITDRLGEPSEAQRYAKLAKPV